MSNFVVSARKYRPIRFDSVVGQAHVANTLKKAISSNHLAQAFLFCGPRGVGKTTCARILAKVLNCEQPTSDTEPCDTCDSCKAFRENASLNVYELDAASNNSVEHIRALIEQVRFAPQKGKYKIYIIDEVHMLSTAAFNAFLKTLEEPPAYAIFILATTEKHKIIPTILSRCQIFDFNRIQVSDMANHLRNIAEKENIEAEDEALHIIGQKADGALRDALSIFDRVVSFTGNTLTYQAVIDNLNILDYDYYFRITDALMTEDTAGLFMLFDQILHKGFDSEVFLNGLAMHLRNLLMCKDPQTLKLLEVTGNIRNKYAQQANLASKSFLVTAIGLINDCDIHFKMARNKRLHIEIYLLKMAYINRTLRVQNLGNTAHTPNAITNTTNTVAPDPKSKDGAPTHASTASIATPPPAAVSVKEQLKEIQRHTSSTSTPSNTNSANSILDSIMAQSKEELKAKEAEKANRLDFTLENIMPFWNATAEKEASTFKRAYYERAKLQISNKNDQPIIHVQVDSVLAKDEITRNGELIGTLRQKLGLPTLQYDITVVVAKEPLPTNIPANAKSLSREEKLQLAQNMLIEENDAVQTLIEKFGLDFKNK